ncbi:TBC1 domain family member 8 [Sciurus carolinensis]|uniref:TBC1 domain family member 8 n=1 Tax=Sciurus carolinensis TaxID=30640 RepID=A0AA41N883_SCICA|nr:TBC1 domain family member 8 [Sciurus carolinensis]
MLGLVVPPRGRPAPFGAAALRCHCRRMPASSVSGERPDPAWRRAKSESLRVRVPGRKTAGGRGPGPSPRRPSRRGLGRQSPWSPGTEVRMEACGRGAGWGQGAGEGLSRGGITSSRERRRPAVGLASRFPRGPAGRAPTPGWSGLFWAHRSRGSVAGGRRTGSVGRLDPSSVCRPSFPTSPASFQDSPARTRGVGVQEGCGAGPGPASPSAAVQLVIPWVDIQKLERTCNVFLADTIRITMQNKEHDSSMFLILDVVLKIMEQLVDVMLRRLLDNEAGHTSPVLYLTSMCSEHKFGDLEMVSCHSSKEREDTIPPLHPGPLTVVLQPLGSQNPDSRLVGEATPSLLCHGHWSLGNDHGGCGT